MFKKGLLKYIVLFIALFSTLGVSNAIGQDLGEISFSGNKKTRSSYLKRFVKSKLGEKVDSVQLELDAKRLRRLKSCSNVQYSIIEKEGSAEVNFEFTEIGTLFPLFGFGALPGNDFVRLGAMDVNAFGIGIETGGFLHYNGFLGGGFALMFPYLFQSNFGLKLDLVKWSSREPLYFDGFPVQYDYANNSFQLVGLYEINRYHQVELGGSLFQETYEKNNPNMENLPGPNKQEIPKQLFKLNFHTDKLDYFFHYRNGWANSSSFQVVFSKDLARFYIFNNITRYFKRVGEKGNWANRLTFGISNNDRTPFAAFAIDGHINIRGVGNRIARGTAIASLNSEFRYTLMDDREQALVGVVFADAAFWREPGFLWYSTQSLENYRVYTGLGLRLLDHRFYGAVIRLDFGLNVLNPKENGFVLGLGQYF